MIDRYVSPYEIDIFIIEGQRHAGLKHNWAEIRAKRTGVSLEIIKQTDMYKYWEQVMKNPSAYSEFVTFFPEGTKQERPMYETDVSNNETEI